MARPKNPNTVKTRSQELQECKNHVEAVERGLIDVSDIPEDNPEDPVIEQKLEYAEKVREEQLAILEKKSAVRELLTLLVQTGSGSPDQVARIRFTLPRKKRADSGEDEGDEVEAEETAEAVA